MKKLFTKILFIAVLCSGVIPSGVQGNLAVDLGKSALTRLGGLEKHPAVVSGLFYGKCAVGLVAAGAALCGVVKFDRFWQSQSKDRYRQRYEELYPIISSVCEREEVNEDKARNIFESGEVSSHKPKWYFPWKKIEFIECFVKYCKEKKGKYNLSAGDGIKIADGQFCNETISRRDNVQKVLNMTTTYLGYLKKPWITKKNLTFAGTAVIVLILVRNKIIRIDFPFFVL